MLSSTRLLGAPCLHRHTHRLAASGRQLTGLDIAVTRLSEQESAASGGFPYADRFLSADGEQFTAQEIIGVLEPCMLAERAHKLRKVRDVKDVCVCVCVCVLLRKSAQLLSCCTNAANLEQS